MILVENWVFSYAFNAPRRNIAIPFGVGKLEWWGYPIVKTLRICVGPNRLDSIPACECECDRRTDKRTSCDGIVRAMHTRRAVKITVFTVIVNPRFSYSPYLVSKCRQLIEINSEWVNARAQIDDRPMMKLSARRKCEIEMNQTVLIKRRTAWR